MPKQKGQQKHRPTVPGPSLFQKPSEEAQGKSRREEEIAHKLSREQWGWQWQHKGFNTLYENTRRGANV